MAGLKVSPLSIRTSDQKCQQVQNADLWGANLCLEWQFIWGFKSILTANLWFMMLGLSMEAHKQGGKIPNLLSNWIAFCSVLSLEGEAEEVQDSKGSLRKAQRKLSNQKRVSNPLSFPHLQFWSFHILFHIIFHIIDSIVYYFPNSNIEKLARLCKTNYRRTR